NPLILGARHHDVRVVVEIFEAEFLICKEAQSPDGQEIDVTLAQFTAQCVRFVNREEMKHDSWITPGEPLDDGRNERPGEEAAASDPHIPSRRIGEVFNILHALPQFVEDGGAAFEERSAIDRRLGTMTVAFK